MRDGFHGTCPDKETFSRVVLLLYEIGGVFASNAQPLFSYSHSQLFSNQFSAIILD